MGIHYHHGWLIWILFFVGQVLHVALQVNSLADSSGKTRTTVLKNIFIPVMWRTFACAMIFGLIWQYPDMIAKLASMVGFNVSSDETSVLAIPMNNFIAGVYGLGLDSALGYIPFLKSQLPVIQLPVKEALADAAAKTVEVAKAIEVAQNTSEVQDKSQGGK